jgi:hypothetical protein
MSRWVRASIAKKIIFGNEVRRCGAEKRPRAWEESNMRAWQTMCVLTGSLVAGSAHSMTVTDYKSRKAEKNTTFYIAGVGAGFYYTMNTAKAMGQSRLYCPASGPGPSGEFYIQLLDDYLTNQGSAIDATTSVEVILLVALMKRFPC